MSLLIETAIAAESIVQAAWARAIANRERLRLRQDLQAVREATDKRLQRLPGWEDAFTNPIITNYRPDEPIAVPALAGGADPAGFFHINNFDVPTGSIYVFSGDRSAYRLGVNDGGFAAFAVPLMLPISERLGLLATATYEPSPSLGPYTYLYSNIFVVGVRTVRQLDRELPTSLRTFFDFAVDYARDAILGGFTDISTLSAYGLYNAGAPTPFGGSPTSYQMIRDGFPFIGTNYDVTDVQAWSELDLSVAPSFEFDELGELFLNLGTVRLSVRQYPGLITPAMLETPEIAVTVPPVYRFGPSVPVASPFFDDRQVQSFAYFFTDLGLPSYCREQLLAMGFTEEDLQP